MRRRPLWSGEDEYIENIKPLACPWYQAKRPGDCKIPWTSYVMKMAGPEGFEPNKVSPRFSLFTIHYSRTALVISKLG